MDMGLMAKRATRGMPLVMPPSVPPERLVWRRQGPAWSGPEGAELPLTGSMTSWTWEPRRFHGLPALLRWRRPSRR